MEKRKQKLRRFLREPALAVLVATLSLAGWLLPLTSNSDAPSWARGHGLFISWAMTIGALFVLSRGLGKDSAGPPDA